MIKNKTSKQAKDQPFTISQTLGYSEIYKITQHDYTVIQTKLGDIKTMLYTNEPFEFIEDEIENVSKMLKNAIKQQNQR